MFAQESIRNLLWSDALARAGFIFFRMSALRNSPLRDANQFLFSGKTLPVLVITWGLRVSRGV